MSSPVHALDVGPVGHAIASASSSPSPPTSPALRGNGAASRTLNLWWRYRDRDLSIDQSLYLKLPRAEERLVARDRDGNLVPLPDDEATGRDFMVEGHTELQLGRLAEVISAWLTLPMRRFYIRSPTGGFLELGVDDVLRRDALIRRMDAFLSHGDGPYRILAVALRPENEDLPSSGEVVTG